ncbi:hypothetical protein DL770_008438 [Monosporascus sp. CRB-9-2]|nr:hypothetical protein DL770_008438 [Monosporascus sp. CRB-9-2]
MSTSTADSAIQQLQEEVTRFKDEVKQLKNQPKAEAPTIATAKIKAKKPEPYDGKGNVQIFLTQARAYFRFLGLEDPLDQILAMAACLTGDAADWFEPIMRNYLLVGESDREKTTREVFEYYVNFEDKLRNNFANPDEERSAAQKLLQLRQKGPASKYAVTFKSLAAKAGYGSDENDIMVDMFYKGLKEDVKDELIKENRTMSFDKYIAEAVKIDNRQFERRQEKKGHFIPKPGYLRANQGKKRDSLSTSYGTYPGPMELGTI